MYLEDCVVMNQLIDVLDRVIKNRVNDVSTNGFIRDIEVSRIERDFRHCSRFCNLGSDCKSHIARYG